MVTDEIKRDHALLGESLRMLKNNGFENPAAVAKLYSIRSAIIAYLNRSDQKLYPPLEEAGKHDSSIAFLYSLHAGDWRGGTKVVQDFFRNHPQPGGDITFVTALGRVAAVLSHRLSNEQQLLPHLEKLNP
jgi:hypothetical protein